MEVKRGIYRLLDGFRQHGAAASVMVNAVIAERAPDTVRAIADAGHEVLSHSYAMDVIPALLSDEDERKNIARCTALLEKASGRKIEGWLSRAGRRAPRRRGFSSRPDTAGTATCSTTTSLMCRPSATGRSSRFRSNRRQRHAVMKYGNAPKTMLDPSTRTSWSPRRRTSCRSSTSPATPTFSAVARRLLL